MKKTLRMFVAIFCGMNIFAACTSDSDNNTSKPRERVITFEGIENSRDMGGLVMQDGRTICFNRLVRSGNLSTATDADVAILKNRYQLSEGGISSLALLHEIIRAVFCGILSTFTPKILIYEDI